jgi:predicted MFS family arabinose efflux permease
LLTVTVGYGWCFTVDAISYLVVILALIMMRVAELYPITQTPRGRGQIRAGFRYVCETPELRISFLMLLIIGTASYDFTVVFPLFVERGLHGGNAEYTLVYSAFSAGAVIGTLVVARRRSVNTRSLILGAAALGVSMLALAFVPTVAAAYPVAALVGGASVAYMTATTALAQLQANRQMVGRVLALQTVLLMGPPPSVVPSSGSSPTRSAVGRPYSSRNRRPRRRDAGSDLRSTPTLHPNRPRPGRGTAIDKSTRT